MNFKTLARILFVLIPTCSLGQSLVTGKVIDSNTKKPIKEASVEIKGTDLKTVTNFLGYFQLNLDSTNTLIVKRQGYEPGQIKVPNASSFQIQLEKEATMPDFENGMTEFYRLSGEYIIYPAKARSKGTQGRVYVSFDLDSLQGVQNIKLIQDIGDNCGEEVIRVLKKVQSKWIPKSKSVTLILPVTFKMKKSEFERVGTDIALPKGKLLYELVVQVF